MGLVLPALVAVLAGNPHPLFEQQGCTARLTLCIGIDGKPTEGETLPTVGPLETLEVKLFGKPNGSSFTLVIRQERRIEDTLFRASGAMNAGEASNDIVLLKQRSVVRDDTETVVVDLLEVKGSERVPIRTLVIPVSYGLYYLDVALLLPFTFDGEQRIETAPVVGTGDRRVVVERDWDLTPAISLNIYPWGRRKKKLSPWSGSFRWGDLLGLQIATDLDLSNPADRFYFGLLLEPVTGLTISSGAALIEVEVLPAGVVPGTLVGANVTDPEFVNRHAFRFYFGVSLSTEVVDVFRKVGKQLTGPDE